MNRMPRVPPSAVGRAAHFVGRRRELALIREMRETVSAWAEPQLAVIQAPPGAGKSALLREAARIAEEERAVVLDIPPATLDSPEGLRGGVLRQLEYRDRWRDLLPRVKVGFSVGADASAEIGGPTAAPARLFLDGLASLSQRCGPDAEGPSCVVVLIDEAQKLAERHRSTVELLLGALRERTGLRTVTLLAGLPDTVDALESPSLGRAQVQFGLGPLRRNESVSLLELWLADNGFRAEGGERLDAIAEHAQDWPEHLMHHIRAMVEAAAENGGVVDAEVVKRTNATAREPMQVYSEGRLRVMRGRAAADHRALMALAVASRDLDGGLSDQLAQQIIEAAGAAPELSMRLEHAGVLVSDRGRSRFAIPSLMRHVIATRRPLSQGLAAVVGAGVAEERDAES